MIDLKQLVAQFDISTPRVQRNIACRFARLCFGSPCKMNKDDLDFPEIDQLTYAGASDSRTCTSPAVLIHTQTRPQTTLLEHRSNQELMTNIRQHFLQTVFSERELDETLCFSGWINFPHKHQFETRLESVLQVQYNQKFQGIESDLGRRQKIQVLHCSFEKV